VNTVTMLLSALLVVATVLCAVAIWAVTEFVKTAKSMRVLSDDLDQRLVPLLDKADVTVDAANAELLRIDGIVTRMEEVTDRVSATSRTVQEVANAPVEIVTDFADRVRHAWKTRKTHTGTSADEPQEPVREGEASSEGRASETDGETSDLPSESVATAAGPSDPRDSGHVASDEQSA